MSTAATIDLHYFPTLRSIIVYCAAALVGAVGRGADALSDSLESPPASKASVPLGLPQRSPPPEESQSPAIIELGKQLFFDTRLSADKSVSCASCHNPQQGWSNGEQVATGIGGKAGTRNVPTVVNSSYLAHFFWDGRVETLEDVVPQPIEHPDEMGLSMDDAAVRLNNIEGYRTQFMEAFGEPATRETLAKAIAAFLRTLVAGDSPFDRYRAGDMSALSSEARAGHDVFMFRANCQMCHRGALLSDGAFHNLGVGMDAAEPDRGRSAVTKDELFDRGAFRTPSLRDVSRTAPYMHDGRFQTLEEVIDFYEHAGDVNPHRMQMLNILVLTDSEKRNLAAFLEQALTSGHYPTMDPPTLPK